MFKELSLFFLISLSCVAARAILGAPITDPSEVAAIQSHTVVLLNTEVEGQHSRCTGTLIGPQTVLTAAHCIPASYKKDLSVVTSIYEFALSERKAVTKVIVHQKYKSFDIPKLNQPNYDIALVQFEGVLPAPYRPTSWSANSIPTMDRFWLYVAGYGVSSVDAADFGEFRTSRVTIENNLYLQRQSFMTGNQRNGEGICKGDSGGPIYLKIQDDFVVIGITSAITGGCTGTSYFNRVSFYEDWIRENISK